MEDGSGLGFGSALGGIIPMGSNPETLGTGITAAIADVVVGLGGETIPGPGLTVVGDGAKGVVVGPIKADTGCRVRGGSRANMSTTQVDQSACMDVSPGGREYRALSMIVCSSAKLLALVGNRLHPNLDANSVFG